MQFLSSSASVLIKTVHVKKKKMGFQPFWQSGCLSSSQGTQTHNRTAGNKPFRRYDDAFDFYFFTSRGTQTTKYDLSFLRKRRKWRGKKILFGTWSKWTCKILVQFGNNFGVTRHWNCDFCKGLLTIGTIARDMSLCNLTYSDSDKCTWQSSEYTWYFWMTDIKSETRGILSFTRVFQLTALAR